MDQITLETLLLPFVDGALDIPAQGNIVLTRAECAPVWRTLPQDRLVCQQSLKSDYDALAADGYTVLPPQTEDLPQAALYLCLPPRQKDEMRAAFARALLAAPEGGIVLACLPNKAGARSAEKALKALAGQVETISKNKCRAFWARKSSQFDHTLAAAWIEADQPRPGQNGLITRPGLFSWDRIDAGSHLLADCLPPHLKGKGADFGSGAGYLARAALVTAARIESMDLIEAEYRAIDLAKQNLSHETRASVHWEDVCTLNRPNTYHFIIMNPPFHTSHADHNALGQAFIRSAANSLKSGGELWMVANRHLPYERTLEEVFRFHERLTDESGYKILRAEKPRR